MTAILPAADAYNITRRNPISSQESFDRKEAVMNLLLDRGACASDVIPPFYKGEWAGPKLIKRLIDGGADVHTKVRQCANHQDQDWWNNHGDVRNVTAIFIACLYGNLGAVKTLLDYRGNGVHIVDMIRSRDSRGRLPLHYATRNRSRFPGSPEDKIQTMKKIIELLLDIDPPAINVQDHQGNTPLHYATKEFGHRGKLCLPIFKFLCDKDADASKRNNKKETPLVALFSWPCSATPWDREAIATLLAHGSEVTDADEDGNTPLHFAVQNLYQVDTVSYLLELGANPVTRSSKFETPLHRAAVGRVPRVENPDRAATEKTVHQEKMLAKLVEFGGDTLMNLPDGEGRSVRQICQEQRKKWKEDEDHSWRVRNGFGRGTGTWLRQLKL